MRKILSLGIIGFMLVNDIVGMAFKKGGLVIYNETEDKVSENLDDVLTRSTAKILSPGNDPNFNDDNTGNFIIENGDPDMDDEYNQDSPDVIQSQNKDNVKCWYPFCEKIETAARKAHKEIDRKIDNLMMLGKKFWKAKMNLIASIPKSLSTFFETIMESDDKS